MLVSATLDDVLAELSAVREAICSSVALNVGTAEACRRLAIGPEHLNQLVLDGEISRIPHLRGRGNGWLYSVKELERYRDEAMRRAVQSRVRAVAS